MKEKHESSKPDENWLLEMRMFYKVMFGERDVWRRDFECLVCGCRLRVLNFLGDGAIIECPECKTEYFVRKDEIELISLSRKVYENSDEKHS